MDWNLVHALLEALIVVAITLAGRYPRIKGELIALESVVGELAPHPAGAPLTPAPAADLTSLQAEAVADLFPLIRIVPPTPAAETPAGE